MWNEEKALMNQIEAIKDALMKVAESLKEISYRCENGASGEDVFEDIYDAAYEIERWC